MTVRTAYRLSEVRAALGISRSTLYRWIGDGKIKVTRVCGRSFVMREDHPAPPVHVPTHVSESDGAKQNGNNRDRLKVVRP